MTLLHQCFSCSTLVGAGAHSWAVKKNIPICEKDELITGEQRRFVVPAVSMLLRWEGGPQLGTTE